MVAMVDLSDFRRSTLLNDLFEVQVPNSLDRECRGDTKDEWLSTASNMNSVIMSIRLAKKENVWDIEYSDSDLDILPRVMRKTLLLFTIHDCNNDTSLINVTKTLDEYTTNAWSSAQKISEFAASSIDKFFDFEFVALPSTTESPTEFDAAVSRLRMRFSDKQAKDYLFKRCYWKLVPIDKLAAHLHPLLRPKENNWRTLMSKLLYHHRTVSETIKEYPDFLFCYDENSEHTSCLYETAIKHAYDKFSKSIKTLQQAANSGDLIEDFSTKIKSCYDDAMAIFDEIALQLQHEYNKRKRKEAGEKCYAAAHQLFCDQVHIISQYMLLQFGTWIKERLEENSMQSIELHILVSAKRSSVLHEFQKSAKECMLEGAGWDFHVAYGKLEQNIVEMINFLFSERALKQNELAVQQRVQAIGHTAIQEESVNTGKKADQDRQNAKTDRQEAIISTLEAAVGVRNTSISELKALLSARDAEIKEKTAINSAQKAKMDEMSAQIDELKADNIRFKKQLAELSSVMAYIVDGQRKERES
ncbi:root hair defective 3 GTP-binding protein-domain-containing protein [Thamnocephalis sphaerospora]|uniref:Root hair defective 3 GTP-binding protein-domain-containing protein n=1 Tax=Thamnocephalis sphaerospora TaxID=78915 RepID=A0A4P9XKJ9_9FUNG|nr:root hair defective 3 GTP-binding protein-domain-containing protein [Thamnocephalis sphaerospora]|eukprot:RKP06295.1 root hair defective 3 GTP-binding protein-domain-containing protein [Thamnocephalis sphaerospora]